MISVDTLMDRSFLLPILFRPTALYTAAQYVIILLLPILWYLSRELSSMQLKLLCYTIVYSVIIPDVLRKTQYSIGTDVQL